MAKQGEARPNGARLGVDIGGTFTDVALETRGQRFSAKILTTPHAPEHGVLAAIHSVLEQAAIKPADLSIIIHGTTLATNAIIERKGAKTALVTTEGFRDTIEIRHENRFEQYDVNIDLPPPLVPRRLRWVVSERIDASGRPSVGLDMRHVDPALFPNVVGALKRAGIDPEHELIPVAPAAHYMMGGIATDLDGRSTVPGLYAVGECACTGLHGANRLASNSLSECFVFGARAARAALAEPAVKAGALGTAEPPPPPAVLTAASRLALWAHAGIERDRDGLWTLRDDPHPLVRLIADAALARTESRGAHQRRDFPNLDPAFNGLHVMMEPSGRPAFDRWV